MFLRPLSRSVSRSLRPNTVRKLSKKPTSFPFQTIPSCPSPTCSCSETPEMPEGFPIDHKKPLNGTMAAYAEQVIICTGKDDWDSRIEDENGGHNLAAQIKKLVGPKGEFHDPYYPISIINSSLDSTNLNPEQEIEPSLPPEHKHVPAGDVEKPTFYSAYLFPSFKYIPFLPAWNDPPGDNGNYLSSATQLRSFAQTHLVPQASSKSNGPFPAPVHTVEDVMVLICGHGGRDIRCGILGPVLRDEFRKVLGSNGIGVTRKVTGIVKGTVKKPISYTIAQTVGGWETRNGNGEDVKPPGSLARVGLISHIGGHKFAGNVIVYLPPQMKTKEGKAHALAGCGIWYGRVEPKHVEGIVKETILGGRVIGDMFRGGIRQGGEMIRM